MERGVEKKKEDTKQERIFQKESDESDYGEKSYPFKNESHFTDEEDDSSLTEDDDLFYTKEQMEEDEKKYSEGSAGYSYFSLHNYEKYQIVDDKLYLEYLKINPISIFDDNHMKIEAQAHILAIVTCKGTIYQEGFTAVELETHFNNVLNSHRTRTKYEKDITLEMFIKNIVGKPEDLRVCLEDKTNFFKLPMFSDILIYNMATGKFLPKYPSDEIKEVINDINEAAQSSYNRKNYLKEKNNYMDLSQNRVKYMHSVNFFMKLINEVAKEKYKNEIELSHIQAKYAELPLVSKYKSIYEKYADKLELKKYPSLNSEAIRHLFGRNQMKKALSQDIVLQKIGHRVPGENFDNKNFILWIKEDARLYTNEEIREVEEQSARSQMLIPVRKEEPWGKAQLEKKLKEERNIAERKKTYVPRKLEEDAIEVKKPQQTILTMPTQQPLKSFETEMQKSFFAGSYENFEKTNLHCPLSPDLEMPQEPKGNIWEIPSQRPSKISEGADLKPMEKLEKKKIKETLKETEESSGDESDSEVSSNYGNKRDRQTDYTEDSNDDERIPYRREATADEKTSKKLKKTSKKMQKKPAGTLLFENVIKLGEKRGDEDPRPIVLAAADVDSAQNTKEAPAETRNEKIAQDPVSPSISNERMKLSFENKSLSSSELKVDQMEEEEDEAECPVLPGTNFISKGFVSTGLENRPQMPNEMNPCQQMVVDNETRYLLEQKEKMEKQRSSLNSEEENPNNRTYPVFSHGNSSDKQKDLPRTGFVHMDYDDQHEFASHSRSPIYSNVFRSPHPMNDNFQRRRGYAMENIMFDQYDSRNYAQPPPPSGLGVPAESGYSNTSSYRLRQPPPNRNPQNPQILERRPNRDLARNQRNWTNSHLESHEGQFMQFISSYVYQYRNAPKKLKWSVISDGLIEPFNDPRLIFEREDWDKAVNQRNNNIVSKFKGELMFCWEESDDS